MAKQRVLHTCLCGYKAPTYSKYRKHLAVCADWRNRPYPRQTAIWRKRLTAKEAAKKPKPVREGVPTVREILETPQFLRPLRENGVDPRAFVLLLRVLAARKESSR